MSKQKKYHYIYKTTCLITGKFYIGMHSTDNLEDNYLGSGKILGYSCNKYGDENHVREILEYASDFLSLALREKEIVNEDLLKDPLNINLKYGGDGGQTSEVTKSGWNSERKKLTSDRVKNLWMNPEYRDKITLSSSISMKQKHADGKIKYDTFTGKSHTEESRRKISESRKGKYCGINNSQFGVKRVGISKNGEIKKVLQSQLSQFLSDGWKCGFKN